MMTDAENLEADAPAETVRCVDCREPIASDADKCRYCQSFQKGLRRLLNISGTVLALAVALLSVMSTLATSLPGAVAVLPEAVAALWPAGEFRVGATISVDQNSGYAFAVNGSDETVTLEQNVDVVVEDSDGNEIHRIGHVFNPGVDRTIDALTLNPSVQRSFYLSRTRGNVRYPELEGDEGCRLDYSVQGADEGDSLSSEIDCWDPE